MEELNEIELTLLKGLTEKHSSFKSHIPYLKVKERNLTGVGMYVNFTYSNFSKNLDNLNIAFSNQENIEIPNLKYGVGYEIDVSDGKIKHIEFITYGENWNGDFTGYKIKPE